MADFQMKLLKCQQCSAGLHPRPGQPLTACAFCGSSYLIEGAPTGALPAAVRWLPFIQTREQARAALDAWLAGGFFRPGDLAQSARLAEPQAVLVPVFLGRARAHSNWSAEVQRTSIRKIKTVVPPGTEIKTGDGVTMRSDSHLISGAHDEEYENVLVLASKGLPEADFSSAAQYDWGKLEPRPESADAAREEPTLTASEAMRQVRYRIEDSERGACSGMIPGGGSVTDLRVNTVVQDLTVELVYVPVWIWGYTYADRHYRALVNGQTAQVAGGTPTSAPRVLTAVLSLLAVPAAIAFYLWRRRR